MSEFYGAFTFSGEVSGTGTYASVRTATGDDGDIYAVKVIEKSQINCDKQAIEKIYREIEILQTLHHPNIVQYYDCFENQKVVHIVLKNMQNGNLRQHLQETESHTENDCKRIVRRICEAMLYCHEQGVIHRDLKPENIMLGNKEEFDDLVVTDFGLARQFDPMDVKEAEMKGQCGTLVYMAPEVMSGRKYNYKCDIWSIGIITYLLVSGGYIPLIGSDNDETEKFVRKGRWKFGPKSAWKNVSTEAKDFITWCLTVDTVLRYNYEQLLNHEWLGGYIFEDNITERRLSREKISTEASSPNFSMVDPDSIEMYADGSDRSFGDAGTMLHA